MRWRGRDSLPVKACDLKNQSQFPNAAAIESMPQRAKIAAMINEAVATLMLRGSLLGVGVEGEGA